MENNTTQLKKFTPETWSERKTASFSFRWRSYGVSVE